MEYGKVCVKRAGGDYSVYIGAGEGIAYKMTTCRKENAYSEARNLRGMFKLGYHPEVIVQNRGYIYIMK